MNNIVHDVVFCKNCWIKSSPDEILKGSGRNNAAAPRRGAAGMVPSSSQPRRTGEVGAEGLSPVLARASDA